MTSPEIRRPSITKPISDGIIDIKKPPHVCIIKYFIQKKETEFFL
jgi:hypothetical protein